MMVIDRLVSIYAGLLACAFMLVACRSAPTRIHTLSAVPPTLAIRAYQGPPIRIDAVHVPPSLDRIEVMSDLAPGEIRIDELDHWAAPLSELAVQVLTADMLARLPPDRVIFPRLAKPEGTLGISVDILDFGANATGLYLQASWMIKSSNPCSPGRRGEGKFTGRSTGATADSTALALDNLLARVADEIAQDLSSNEGTSNGM